MCIFINFLISAKYVDKNEPKNDQVRDGRISQLTDKCVINLENSKAESFVYENMR